MIGVPHGSASRRQFRSNTIIDGHKTQLHLLQQNRQQQLHQQQQQHQFHHHHQQPQQQHPRARTSNAFTDIVEGIGSFHINPIEDESTIIDLNYVGNPGPVMFANKRRPPIGVRSRTIDVPTNEQVYYNASIPLNDAGISIPACNIGHCHQYYENFYNLPLSMNGVQMTRNQNIYASPRDPYFVNAQTCYQPNNNWHTNNIPLNYHGSYSPRIITNHSNYDHICSHPEPNNATAVSPTTGAPDNISKSRSNSHISETGRQQQSSINTSKVARRANTASDLLANRGYNVAQAATAKLAQNKPMATPTSDSSNEIKSSILSKPKRSAMTPMKLSLAGAKRRLGFRKKGLTQINVHRSEEVIPDQARHLFNRSVCQSVRSDAGNDRIDCSLSSRISPFGNDMYYSSNLRKPPMSSGIDTQGSGKDDSSDFFIEDLGEGQVVSRQALVSPHLGDIQLSLSTQRAMLEVEVIRARNLHKKPTALNLPNPYVKVYLMKGKICISKFKTEAVQETLNPLYQTRFVFRDVFDITNCILQVIVWGNYGRKDRKSLMGIAQIHLDQADLSILHVGWYKLFNLPSLSGVMLSSQALRNKLLAVGSNVTEPNANRESN